MLLEVIVRSNRKKELLDYFWNALLGEEDLVKYINSFYQLFCLVAHADLLLAKARDQLITEPYELN